MAKKRSRFWIMTGGGVALAAALVYAFWPRPVPVDMGAVTRGPIAVTVTEEARTRVRDPYTVVAPVAGQLLRVEVEPGDAITAGETVMARIAPSAPPMLDERARAEARAAVAAAGAALRVARAERESAEADRALAAEELERTRRLREAGTVSQATLDEAVRAANAANAAHEAAEATVALREAELESAQAQLVSVSDILQMGDDADSVLSLTAPISGTVLSVEQRNAAPVGAGTAIMEIGDIADDLEVVAKLLSTDAVQVAPGDRVTIAGWGGGESLAGTVARVEPGGFTEVSALGVQEQRVNVIVGFGGEVEIPQSLGAGYRVEVEIVTWEEEDALIAPSSALFREGDGWAVFTVTDDQARLTSVEVGRNNGTSAQILGGLEEGDPLILYPGPELADGTSVERRGADEA